MCSSLIQSDNSLSDKSFLIQLLTSKSLHLKNLIVESFLKDVPRTRNKERMVVKQREEITGQLCTTTFGILHTVADTGEGTFGGAREPT